MFPKIDVRPVPFDTLIQWDIKAIEERKKVCEDAFNQYEGIVERVRADLDEVTNTFEFVKVELEATDLAMKVKNEELVRVQCPQCLGTGMKPTDAFSGNIGRYGSAFENTPIKKQETKAIDPAFACEKCEGKKYIIMSRFYG